MSKKNFLSSMSFQGGAVAASLGLAGWGKPVSVALNMVGVPIEPEQASEAIDAITTLVGILMTVFGTWRRADIKVL